MVPWSDAYKPPSGDSRGGSPAMTITDTQVLSYYYKAVLPSPVAPISISSITAAEFLLMQSKQNGANYYPILPSMMRHRVGSFMHVGSLASGRMMFDSKRHAMLGKHRTDQLVLNFNGRMPSFVEFGGLAISQIINDGHYHLFSASISHMGKALRKKLQDRLRFLMNSNVQCLAVTPGIADIGMNILGQFLDKYEAKQNTRNTVNDMLILATAIQYEMSLLTEDGLLKRFTAQLLGAPCIEKNFDRVLIDFKRPTTEDRRKTLESKGYINRGWQVMERRSFR
jgi:predicted nucleic acid-binding protein